MYRRLRLQPVRLLQLRLLRLGGRKLCRVRNLPLLWTRGHGCGPACLLCALHWSGDCWLGTCLLGTCQALHVSVRRCLHLRLT